MIRRLISYVSKMVGALTYTKYQYYAQRGTGYLICFDGRHFHRWDENNKVWVDWVGIRTPWDLIRLHYLP